MSYFDTDDPDTKDLNPAMKLLDEILGGKEVANVEQSRVSNPPTG